MTKVFDSCRLCGNKALIQVLDLGVQPLSGVYVRPSDPDPISTPIELLRCDVDATPGACGLVQLRHSADVDSMYGMTYGYRSGTSPLMRNHLEQTARRLKDRVGLKPGDAVLDIACNDGTLLNSYAGNDYIRIGIDPSSRKFHEFFDKDIKVAFEYFSADTALRLTGGVKCRAITSIAMFYDLDDPVAFAKDIARTLAPDGLWSVEQAYLPAMLRKLIYDQILHEHVTYFAFTQMERVLEAAGLRVVDVELNEINGGSFNVIACHKDADYPTNHAIVERLRAEEAVLNTAAPWQRLASRMQAHRSEVREFVDLATAAGRKIYGYGASTKGNIQLQYCGLRPGDLVAISDKQAQKNGLQTPGTRFDIVSHEMARAAKPDYFFVLVWHLRREVILDELPFLEAGGKLIFSLPRFQVIDKDNYKDYLDRDFEDFAFPM